MNINFAGEIVTKLQEFSYLNCWKWFLPNMFELYKYPGTKSTSCPAK